MNRILAKCETRMQMGNPIKVLTSGVEGVMREGEPQYLSENIEWSSVCPGGKHTQTALLLSLVITGEVYKKHKAKNRSACLVQQQLQNWLGAKENTYCIDFSVGRRYRERRNGTTNNFWDNWEPCVYQNEKMECGLLLCPMVHQ